MTTNKTLEDELETAIKEIFKRAGTTHLSAYNTLQAVAYRILEDLEREEQEKRMAKWMEQKTRKE